MPNSRLRWLSTSTPSLPGTIQVSGGDGGFVVAAGSSAFSGGSGGTGDLIKTVSATPENLLLSWAASGEISSRRRSKVMSSSSSGPVREDVIRLGGSSPHFA